MRTALLLSAAACALTTGVAHAQDAGPASPPSAAADAGQADATVDDANEIIVTAERRQQRLDTVPLAITAISGADLERNRVLKAQDLTTAVPSLTLVQNRLGGYKISVRGIGGSAGNNLGTNNKIAVFVDDVYLSRQGAQDLAFFDLDRIEVLKGPQGTLYGKNAVAGAINIYTALPSETLLLKAAVDVGNYNTINTRFLVSGPLGGDLSAKIAFGNNYHDGFGKNLTTGNKVSGQESYFGRATLRYKPGDWDFILSGDYEKDPDQPGLGAHILGTGYAVPLGGGAIVFGPPGIQDVYNDVDNRASMELAGASFKAIDTGEDVVFTSITGYRWSDRTYNYDVDASNSATTPPRKVSLTSYERQYSSTLSQELRLSSTENGGASLDGKLFWSLGAYFFYENGFNNDGLTFSRAAPTAIGPVTERTTMRLKTYNYALYGQGTYNLTDALSFTAGLRYNWEKKEALFNASGTPVTITQLYSNIPIEASWKNASPKATLAYRLGSNGTIYATYARGFLSGAFSQGPANAAIAASQQARPEIDDNFEIGIKKTLLDGALYVSLAGYYIDYKDLQIQRVPTGGTAAVLSNAGGATSKGIEFELHARPTSSLQLDVGYAYTDARYTRFCSGGTDGNLVGTACTTSAPGAEDKAGQVLEYYSPHVIHAGFDWTLPLATAGDFSLRGDWNYYSHDSFPGYYQPGYQLINGGLRYRTADKNLSVELFARNLADARYATGCPGTGRTSNGGACTIGSPRTFGVSLIWQNR